MADADNGIHPNIESIILFAEECIYFVLMWYNLKWNPPVPREHLRKYSNFDIYTIEIGKALAHSCLKTDSKEVGEMVGFDVEKWLQMKVDKAEEYVGESFRDYLFFLPLGVFKCLYLWSFACYLCRQAIKRNRKTFTYHVLSQLVNTMYANHKFQDYYESLNERATTYNKLHYFLHNQHSDEGYSTT